MPARLETIGRDLPAVVLSPDMVRLNRVLTAEAYRVPSLIQMLMQQIEQGPIPQLARLLMEECGGSGTPAREDAIAARLFYDMVSGAPLWVALTGRQKLSEMPEADWVRHAVGLFLLGWQAGP